MYKSPEDQAPEISSVRVPFEDGTAIQISWPRAKVDRMASDDKNRFLDSVGELLNCLIKGTSPHSEDFDNVMSIEGTSIILPESHGTSELQTLLGEQIISGSSENISKYLEPEA